MRICIIFNLLFVFLLSVNSYALDLTGARPLGLAGAFVALADDGNSVFWNPAGMKQSSKNIVNTNYNLDRLNQVPHGSLSVINSKEESMLDGGIGISRHNARISGVNYLKTDIVIALADQYTKFFTVGISGKYSKEETHTLSSQTVFTMDAGGIFTLGESVKIGIAGYNLTDPSLNAYKRKIQTGININFGKMVNLAADISRFFHSDSNDKNNYSIGAEVLLGKSFVLRGGYTEEKIYDNRYVTGGFSLLNEMIILDYAYVHNMDSRKTERHMLGVTYPF